MANRKLLLFIYIYIILFSFLSAINIIRELRARAVAACKRNWKACELSSISKENGDSQYMLAAQH